ncbi:hypothetical protein B6F84_00845 [Acidianus manzaensis]|uniref:N-acetyltransferase domain-containing protein n=2 Tax=Acidianus manzaensis TaxID=282676 RepID=A0A1W6JWV0_9CREN|nr:hypothetical protein B6F84_00845 [Acidianus manzaensis]
MKLEKRIVIVAEINKKAIGIADLAIGSYRSSHTANLAISIRREYRNIGVGKKLIELGKQKGVKVIYLEVMKNNKHAIHLYEKIGFRNTGIFPKKYKYKDEYVDGLLYTFVLE